MHELTKLANEAFKEWSSGYDTESNEYIDMSVDQFFIAGYTKAQEPLERMKSPLAPIGLLIRALRCIAGTTLMEMSRELGMTPAELSSLEMGRKHVTLWEARGVVGFFASKGMPVDIRLLKAAMRAGERKFLEKIE